MLNIGICDDDQQFTNQLENLILKYLENNSFKADIQTFTKSRDLLQYIQNEEDLDMLFLDIELDDVTGIDIGNSLRSEFHNDSVQIVFVSSKENYAIQLFNIRPLNFLVKPIDYGQVEYIMDEYNRLFKFQHSYFEYHVGKKAYQIDEQSILYFQSVGKKINMVTCGREKVFYGKLSDVYERLNAHSYEPVTDIQYKSVCVCCRGYGLSDCGACSCLFMEQSKKRCTLTGDGYADKGRTCKQENKGESGA